MKSLKTILFALAISFTSSALFAQETVNSPEEKATKQTAHLTNELALTAAQQEQIYAINLGIIQKNDAVRANESMSSELKTESIKQNDEARKQLIKGVLTPEQIEKFDAIEKIQPLQRKQLNGTVARPEKKN